jgi:hypothetical protein
VLQEANPSVTSTGCIRTGEQEIAMLSFQVRALRYDFFGA